MFQPGLISTWYPLKFHPDPALGSQFDDIYIYFCFIWPLIWGLKSNSGVLVKLRGLLDAQHGWQLRTGILYLDIPQYMAYLVLTCQSHPLRPLRHPAPNYTSWWTSFPSIGCIIVSYCLQFGSISPSKNNEKKPLNEAIVKSGSPGVEAIHDLPRRRFDAKDLQQSRHCSHPHQHQG